MFTHGRKTIDLNGTWKFCPDPMQRCRQQKWWVNPSSPNKAFPCWDREGLWDIQVPGTWKTQVEEMTWYDGHVVYLKDFTLDTEIRDDEEAFLVFDGVIYTAEIYLNGCHVGAHDWGYSPFRFRVTDMLHKHNELFVLVENHLRDDRVPGTRYDWNNDGGIVNPVKLVIVPTVHVHNFRTQTRLDGDAVYIDAELLLAGLDTEQSEAVTFEIPELGLSTTVEACVDQSASVSLSIPHDRIELWSPEKPKLYRTVVTTAYETLTDEVGYREIRTEGQRLLLNGAPIRLYGLSVHSEFPGTGRTATPDGIERMIGHAKDLGLNFLRCAHYPYAEEFGRAMDRAGLMWWEEVPAYWQLKMAEEHVCRLACGMMEETVRRDWNRASLIIWSVSNECCWRNPDDFTDNNYAYWYTVVPMIRDLDPSRLISCAEAGNMVTTTPIWNPDSADEFQRDTKDAGRWRPAHADDWYKLFDILAANIYLQEIGDAAVAYPNFVRMLKRFNKPLMLSEFGSMSLLGSDAPDDRLGNEQRHAALIVDAYKTFADLPELIGYSPWILMDVRVPLHWRWYNQGKGVFRYGLLDENWQKKKAYDALKRAIADLKEKLSS